MTDSDLHSKSLVIDALQCSDFNRELLLEAQKGGVTAISASSVLWENFRGGMEYVIMWKRKLAEISSTGGTLASTRSAKVVAKLSPSPKSCPGSSALSLPWATWPADR